MPYDEVEFRRLIHKYKVTMVGLGGVTPDEMEKEHFYMSYSGTRFSRESVQKAINDKISDRLNELRREVDVCENDLIEYES